MPKTTEKLTISGKVEAKPEEVFYLFATAQGWRDWLCNGSRFEAWEGGTYQLAWLGGWYATGKVLKLKRPQQVRLTWWGSTDPGPTEVALSAKGVKGGSRVRIVHQGFGRGKAWARAMDEACKGWQKGLENMVSILSTGQDLRLTRRPMLGIQTNDFSETIAAEIGVPVKKGVRVDKPLSGMGAERAGVQPNDVIVRMGNTPISSYSGLAQALQGRQAGDVVSIAVYRGPKKLTLRLELSARSIEPFPLDPAGLAERILARNKEALGELRKLLEGVTEAEAGFSATPEQWSAKENLAHLIDAEAGTQAWLADLVNDNERDPSDGGGNIRAQLQAMVKSTPTTPTLLQRLEKAMEENADFLSRAEALKARKGALWRFGYNVLQLTDHTRGHMAQMREAIAAARKGHG